MMSIVTTGAETGYYVDVFRSRKEKGGDKMHDYFYHNLGQTLTLTAADGSDLNLQPTEELAFAGAHPASINSGVPVACDGSSKPM